jgi:hypothetical protein
MTNRKQVWMYLGVPFCIHIADMQSRMHLDLMLLNTCASTSNVNCFLLLSQNITQSLHFSTNNNHSLLRIRSLSLEQRDT